MLNLVTDRTQANVNLLNRLRKKLWSDMTPSEQLAWYGDAAKGAYNYTDLNRVESAVAEIADRLGLSLVTKTDWGLWDIPLASDMERYLRNVAAIRDACPGERVFPPLPDSMSGLNYVGANNIEETLLIVYWAIDSGMRLGDVYSGEVL